MRRIWVVITPFAILLGISDGSERNKRQLMFPPESVMQLAFAVITPGEVTGRMLTTNLGIMFNINLPTNITSWYPWRPDYRRRRSASDIHFSFYTLLENLLTISGLDGKTCLQKSFCQLMEAPVGNHDLPHQLLNIIFGNWQIHKEIFEDYERNVTSCSAAYTECSVSPVDLFFHLYYSSWSRNQ